MHTEILKDLIVVFILSVGVIFLFLRMRVPSIVGFLITGIIAGPQGLGLIGALSDVEFLSELGVVLLLFSIGIEFSLKSLIKIKRTVLLGGSVQVCISFIFIYMICHYMGLSINESIFMGLLVSLSSTAIVLKILDELSEITSPHGKNILAILIFQDILVVPIMIFIPFLAGSFDGAHDSAYFFVVKGVGLILFVILCYKWIIPNVLFQIVSTRSRELFQLSIILICLGVAWLTSVLGFSLALGAFLAGLIISESEYAQEALGRIMPFRDIFVGFFFISIGMLLNINYILEHPWLILSIGAGVIVLKAFSGGVAILILGFPLRVAILTGFALAQIGEFSFILSKVGIEYGIMNSNAYQLFLAVSLMTMAATPFIMKAASPSADLFMQLPLPEQIKSGYDPKHAKGSHNDRQGLIDHMIIIGYGINGRNVSKAAKVSGIPYVILEINPETVREEKADGQPIFYGDATQGAILEHANVSVAKVVVIAIPDASATRRITAKVRELSPKAHIIARTRYVSEVHPLYKMGADEVIPEEYETSIEIISRALSEYMIPRDDVEMFIADIRSGGYEMFRSLSGEATTKFSLKYDLPDFKITTLRVNDACTVCDKSLNEIELRKRYRVSILAIRRRDQTILNPGGDDILNSGDVIVVSGQIENILEVMPLMRSTSD